jgi:DNA-binding NarL/FixJ family response regulator
MRVRVAIVSNRPLVEAGVRRMLADVPDLLVAEPGRSDGGVPTGACDVALLDLTDGQGASRALPAELVTRDVVLVALYDGTGDPWEGAPSRAVRTILPLSVGKEELAAAILAAAYRKIDVHSRSQAVLWALDHHLVGRRQLPRSSREEP